MKSICWGEGGDNILLSCKLNVLFVFWVVNNEDKVKRVYEFIVKLTKGDTF